MEEAREFLEHFGAGAPLPTRTADGLQEERVLAVRIVTIDWFRTTMRSLFPHATRSLLDEDASGAALPRPPRKDSRPPVMRITGSTLGGQTCCLYVHGVYPTFYVEAPVLSDDAHVGRRTVDDREGDLRWDFGVPVGQMVELCEEFRTELDEAVRRTLKHDEVVVHEVLPVMRLPFYGYHREKVPFLRVSLYSPSMVSRCVGLLAGGAVGGRVWKVFEAHVAFPLQFFMDNGITGMGHIRATRHRFRGDLPASGPDFREFSLVGGTADMQAREDVGKRSNACDDVWTAANTPMSNRWTGKGAPRRQSSCALEADVHASTLVDPETAGYSQRVSVRRRMRPSQTLSGVTEVSEDSSAQHPGIDAALEAVIPALRGIWRDEARRCASVGVAPPSSKWADMDLSAREPLCEENWYSAEIWTALDERFREFVEADRQRAMEYSHTEALLDELIAVCGTAASQMPLPPSRQMDADSDGDDALSAKPSDGEVDPGGHVDDIIADENDPMDTGRIADSAIQQMCCESQRFREEGESESDSEEDAVAGDDAEVAALTEQLLADDSDDESNALSGGSDSDIGMPDRNDYDAEMDDLAECEGEPAMSPTLGGKPLSRVSGERAGIPGTGSHHVVPRGRGQSNSEMIDEGINMKDSSFDGFNGAQDVCGTGNGYDGANDAAPRRNVSRPPRVGLRRSRRSIADVASRRYASETGQERNRRSGQEAQPAPRELPPASRSTSSLSARAEGQNRGPPQRLNQRAANTRSSIDSSGAASLPGIVSSRRRRLLRASIIASRAGVAVDPCNKQNGGDNIQTSSRLAVPDAPTKRLEPDSTGIPASTAEISKERNCMDDAGVSLPSRKSARRSGKNASARARGFGAVHPAAGASQAEPGAANSASCSDGSPLARQRAIVEAHDRFGSAGLGNGDAAHNSQPLHGGQVRAELRGTVPARGRAVAANATHVTTGSDDNGGTADILSPRGDVAKISTEQMVRRKRARVIALSQHFIRARSGGAQRGELRATTRHSIDGASAASGAFARITANASTEEHGVSTAVEDTGGGQIDVRDDGLAGKCGESLGEMDDATDAWRAAGKRARKSAPQDSSAGLCDAALSVERLGADCQGTEQLCSREYGATSRSVEHRSEELAQSVRTARGRCTSSTHRDERPKQNTSANDCDDVDDPILSHISPSEQESIAHVSETVSEPKPGARASAAARDPSNWFPEHCTPDPRRQAVQASRDALEHSRTQRKYSPASACADQLDGAVRNFFASDRMIDGTKDDGQEEDPIEDPNDDEEVVPGSPVAELAAAELQEEDEDIVPGSPMAELSPAVSEGNDGDVVPGSPAAELSPAVSEGIDGDVVPGSPAAELSPVERRGDDDIAVSALDLDRHLPQERRLLQQWSADDSNKDNCAYASDPPASRHSPVLAESSNVHLEQQLTPAELSVNMAGNPGSPAARAVDVTVACVQRLGESPLRRFAGASTAQTAGAGELSAERGGCVAPNSCSIPPKEGLHDNAFMFVYEPTPPNRQAVGRALRFQYEDVYYSDPRDIPRVPFQRANRVFRIGSRRVNELPDAVDERVMRSWCPSLAMNGDTSWTSKANTSIAETDKQYQEQSEQETLLVWEFLGVPPSRAAVHSAFACLDHRARCVRGGQACQTRIRNARHRSRAKARGTGSADSVGIDSHGRVLLARGLVDSTSDEVPRSTMARSSKSRIVSPGPARLSAGGDTSGQGLSQSTLATAAAEHLSLHVTRIVLEVVVAHRAAPSTSGGAGSGKADRFYTPDPEQDGILAACLLIHNEAAEVALGAAYIPLKICVLVDNQGGAGAHGHAAGAPERSRGAPRAHTHADRLRAMADATTIHVEDSEVMLINRIVEIVRTSDPDFLIGWEVQRRSWGYFIERSRAVIRKGPVPPAAAALAPGRDIVEILARWAAPRAISSSEGDSKDENVRPAHASERSRGDLFPAAVRALPGPSGPFREARAPEGTGADSFRSRAARRYQERHGSGLHVTGRIMLNVWRIMTGEVKLHSYDLASVAWSVLRLRVPVFPDHAVAEWVAHGFAERALRHTLLRCSLTDDLLERIDYIVRTAGMARLFGIDFFSVMTRGSQYRVEAMMLRLAHERGMVALSPTREEVRQQRAIGCIPLVMEPVSRFYTSPVLVLDFQSLYPSMMIAHNLCFSTCMGQVGSREWKSLGVLSRYRVPRGLASSRPRNVFVAPNGAMFVRASERQGILPHMLHSILKTRVMVKQAVKNHRSDARLASMLNATQFALKMIANVTYGYTAASYSGRMPCADVADAIVQCGRETLERAMREVQSEPSWDAHVVYGDTDSMFVHLPGRSVEEAFRIGRAIESRITRLFPPPVKLKLEKVYVKSLLVTKKRYVGLALETESQAEPVFDDKGIETVRRDNCPALVRQLEQSLRILFATADLSAVKKYLQREWGMLLAGRYPLSDLVFHRAVRYGTYATLPLAAVVAEERRKWDPRAVPLYRERVRYVVVHRGPGARVMDLVAPPEEIVASRGAVAIHGEYYVERHILPALDRILGLAGAPVAQWIAELPRSAARAPSLGRDGEGRSLTLRAFFQRGKCSVCGYSSSSNVDGGLCSVCRRSRRPSMAVLAARHGKAVERQEATWRVCVECAGCANAARACVAVECPVFDVRRQATLDADAAEASVLAAQRALSW